MKTHVLIASAFWSLTATAQLFGPQQPIWTVSDGPRTVHAADLDGDGDQDVLSASTGGATPLAWYENLGAGTFGPAQGIGSEPQNAISVFATDLDGDTDLDVLAAFFNINDRIVWYPNNGDGTFAQQEVITTLVDYPNAIYSVDLDDDGDMDVLSASLDDDKVAWYANNGFGGFSQQIVLSNAADYATSVHVGDLDGDDDLDVLSASGTDDKLAWYENQGSGFFGSQQIISTANSARHVQAADLDNDDDLDVLLTSYNDDKIVWFENDGSAAFGPEQLIASGVDAAIESLASDVDGDGDLDVVSAIHNDNKIVWYENLGDGNFAAEQVITTQTEFVNSIYLADLDGDDFPDLLSASVFDDKIAWYENLTSPLQVEAPSAPTIGLFPDPVVDKATVVIDGLDGEVDVEVHDMTGVLVVAEHHSVRGGRLSLDRGALTPGVYVLRVIGDQASTQTSFVVD